MPDPNDYIPDWTEDDITRRHLDERDADEERPEPDEDLYLDR